MGSTPVYNLTWGEYGSSLISAVQLLRCHGELVDVTLAAGGRTFHAHKVVLCAASPFLLDLLKSTTCKHPVVMLAGVQAADLEALLEFVYRGEVSVDQNQLPSLLQAAHCLSIQGLAPSTSSAGLQQEHQVHPQEASKNEVAETEVVVYAEAEAEDDAPTKRKKRGKRPRSPSGLMQSVHSEKVYIQAADNGQEASPNVNAPIWTPHMNIISLTAAPTMEVIPNQSPALVVENTATSISNNEVPPQTPSNLVNSSGTKLKGASDQPGVCPLCGAMLRQARNLRRHLVTSCKYRMLNGVPQGTSSSQLDSETELTQLQAVPLQNVERVMQSNVELLENKSVVLTPISCTELLSPNTSIITVTSGTMQ